MADLSIYKQEIQRADIGAGLERGMRLGQLAQQKKLQDKAQAEDDAINEAFRQNTVTGEDGSVRIDRNATLAQLYKNPSVSPTRIMQIEREQNNQDMDDSLKKFDYIRRVVGSAFDQNTWTAARQDLIDRKLFDANSLSEAYDPNLQGLIIGKLGSQEDQLKAKRLANQTRALDIQEQRLNAPRNRTGNSTGSGAAQVQEKPMTESQSKSLSFGRRAMLSNQLVNQISADPKADVSSISTQLKMRLPTWMGGLKNDSEQALQTAKLGFIASVLRKESGAAVSPQEFSQYDTMYFPQPGDSPQTLEDKKVLRENFIDTEKQTAGRAWKDPIPLNRKSDGGDTKVWEGVTYKRIGDQWVPQ